MFLFSKLSRSLLVLLLIGLYLSTGNIKNVHATLPTISSKAIADSEEPFNRRIYSYDIQVDAQGDVHIIYSKPSSGRKSNIYYIRRVSGHWEPQILVSSDGYYDNKCTFLLVDDNGAIHVCYTKDEGDAEGMYYRTIINGSVGQERFVYEGGWWGRMTLGENGYPTFVSGGMKWPNPDSRMLMHTTTNGLEWEVEYLDIPAANRFQLGDFIYSEGRYHITYGDSQYQKLAWKDKAMQEKVMDTFHGLHYVTSTDGVNWAHHLVDNSQTLRNIEFWTKMVLDRGRPLVAMYKYAEYGNLFNSGTSAQLSEWTGAAWNHKIITNQIYPDTNEGMGVGLAVNGPGDYFGAWDFSPRYPQIIPGSIRGNTAMRRSGVNGKWENVVQLDPFSLEGRAKFATHNGKLFFLALGDYTDTKLYFREFSIPVLNTILPPNQSNTSSLTPIIKLLLGN